MRLGAGSGRMNNTYPSTSEPTAKNRILVVDDDDANREFLRNLLGTALTTGNMYRV